MALMLALVESEALAVLVVTQALNVNLMLGARLAGEVRSGFRTFSIDQVNRLIQKSTSRWLQAEYVRNFEHPHYLLPETTNHLPQYEPIQLNNLPSLEQSREWLNSPDDYVRGNSSYFMGLIAKHFKNKQITALEMLHKVISNDSSWSVRARAIHSVEIIGHNSSIAMLVELADNPSEDLNIRDLALSVLCSFPIADVVQYIARLSSLIDTKVGRADFQVVQEIQANCKFYNYEIEQQAKLRKADRPSPEGGGGDPFSKIEDKLESIDRRTKQMADQPKNNFSGATFSGPVNLGDNPTGDFVGTQNNYTTDPEITSAIADLKNLITDLQTQHPTVTTEAQAIEIIDAEFIEIQQNPHHKLATLRKQILNPERHAQAFKAAIVDYAKTTCEKSPLIQASIAYFDKLSETPDRGA